MTTQIVILLLLLLLSGFFSSAETAMFSISRIRARHIAKQQEKSFQLIQQMKENPHRLLSTILIGNNIVNVGASAMATSLTLQIFPNYAVGLATGVMTFLILVFGEVFPKSTGNTQQCAYCQAHHIPHILAFDLLLSDHCLSELHSPHNGQDQKNTERHRTGPDYFCRGRGRGRGNQGRGKGVDPQHLRTGRYRCF